MCCVRVVGVVTHGVWCAVFMWWEWSHMAYGCAVFVRYEYSRHIVFFKVGCVVGVYCVYTCSIHVASLGGCLSISSYSWRHLFWYCVVGSCK